MKQFNNTMSFLMDSEMVSGSLRVTHWDTGIRSLSDEDPHTGRATTIAVIEGEGPADEDTIVYLADPFLRRGREIHQALIAMAPVMGYKVVTEG